MKIDAKKQKRLDYRNYKIFCVAMKTIITITTMALGVMAIVSLFCPNYDFEEVTYTVERGDSLWAISKNYCPNDMDRHDYIALVMGRNGLSTTDIDPGQCLVMYSVQDQKE